MKRQRGVVALEFAIVTAVGFGLVALLVTEIFVPVLNNVVDLHAHLHAQHHPVFVDHTH